MCVCVLLSPTALMLTMSNVFATVIDEVLTHVAAGNEAYQTQIGYLGLATQACALIALVATGRWLDHSKAF